MIEFQFALITFQTDIMPINTLQVSCLDFSTLTLNKLNVDPVTLGSDWNYDAVVWLHHPSMDMMHVDITRKTIKLE